MKHIKSFAVSGLMLGLSIPAGAQSAVGAGSVGICPVIARWSSGYKAATGIEVNYQATGSAAGVKALNDGTIDFACSDFPVDAMTVRASTDAIAIPAIKSNVAIVYNLPGLEERLHLSGAAIADVYRNRIKYWDDATLCKLNPGVKLPHEEILVIGLRGSTATPVICRFLSAAAHVSIFKMGAIVESHLHLGLQGVASTGILSFVRNHRYTFGFATLAQLKYNQLPTALVADANGQFVSPEPTQPLVDGPKLISAPYPIAVTTYLIVDKHARHAADVSKFITWCLTSGQCDMFIDPKLYVPTPFAERQRALKELPATSVK